MVTVCLHLYRVLSAHQQLLTGGGSGACEMDGAMCDVGSTIQLLDDVPVLSQQQLETTFISTADFLVSLSHVSWPTAGHLTSQSPTGIRPVCCKLLT